MKTNEVSEIKAQTQHCPEQPAHDTLPGTLDRLQGESPYKRKRWYFAAIVACQLLMLTGLGSLKAYTLFTGTNVTLITTPVDPRDLFRGDYVSLNYDISAVPTEENFSTGDSVYVILRQGTPGWTAEKVVAKADLVPPSAVAIKGRVDWQEYPRDNNKRKLVHLHYGIEQAFVPEGKGHELESKRHLTVQVAVDRFGNSVVKNVKSQ